MLGCKPGSAAFRRRALAAREAYLSGWGASAGPRAGRIVVACGGRAWDGQVEADELARLIVGDGLPSSSVVRERCSLDTKENARFAAELLSRRGIDEVLVVTCSWHLPRAVKLFRAVGLRAEGLGIEPPSPPRLSRLYWAIRERVSTWKDLGPWTRTRRR